MHDVIMAATITIAADVYGYIKHIYLIIFWKIAALTSKESLRCIVPCSIIIIIIWHFSGETC